jgi:hypothetical protein
LNPGILILLSLSLFRLENRVYLSHGVQVAGVTCCAATRIVAGVKDLMQRTGECHTGRVLRDWVIKRSGGTVCSLHRADGDENHGFLG